MVQQGSGCKRHFQDNKRVYRMGENTTYTVIKRLIDKGAIKRKIPGFMCVHNIEKNSTEH